MKGLKGIVKHNKATVDVIKYYLLVIPWLKQIHAYSPKKHKIIIFIYNKQSYFIIIYVLTDKAVL